MKDGIDYEQWLAEITVEGFRELVRDRERLDWLEVEMATVQRRHRNSKGWGFRVSWARNGKWVQRTAATVRAALDAAMGRGA